MNKEREQVFRRLQSAYAKFSTLPESNQIRWLLAVTSLLVHDDVCVSNLVLPFLEANWDALHSVVIRLVEDQSELAVVALRFLAAAVVLTSRTGRQSHIHVLLCGKKGGDFVAILVALSKTDDPVVCPHLQIIFSSLACGPCSVEFAQSLVEFGGPDALRMTLRFVGRAHSRGTGMDLLGLLLTTVQGARLCATMHDAVESETLGTHLQKQWRLMHRV